MSKNCHQNGDARNMVDVKSRISEGSNDKSKIWKLIEINEPSHCRSLKLPENVKVNKVILNYRIPSDGSFINQMQIVKNNASLIILCKITVISKYES
jgi:hypothetical protein